MSERIDHATEARDYLADVEAYGNDAHSLRFDKEPKHRISDALAHGNLAASQAQVHATLALVEQQRIANLIALWHGSPVKEEYIGDGERGLLVSSGGVLRPEIREALGL
ncbi:hypothetical protein ACIFOC_00389 [Leucobacter aridicollis]|uniref:hypothetical protein n=1 Tax=Leucobacter aridicollis TaxID=283878 RepID=UPI0037CAC667